MELYFLSVGYGESIVLLDGEHCLVIDGGPGRGDSAYYARGTICLADFLQQKQVKRIDCMICTHLHNDHIGGLVEVAARFPVDKFWTNFWSMESAQAAIDAAQTETDLSLRLFTQGLQHWERLRQLFIAQGTPIFERTATQEYETLWSGCKIRLFGMDRQRMTQRTKEYNTFCTLDDPAAQREAMHAFDRVENTCSLACSLELNGWRVMLTGDLCSGWETRCSQNFPDAEVLKLTHHGQKDGMPQVLVEACDPYVFLICADAARTFQSACEAVQERAKAYLQAQNRPIHIYTTGLLGEQFGEKDGKLPCALCCTAGEPVCCTPYYAEEESM